MASKNLFPSASTGNAQKSATVTNEAGGKAYDLGPEHTLAQLACMGCLTDTYYANAETQLDKVLELAAKCSSAYLGKLAVYSRTQGYMKDMPALLCAILASRKDETSRNTLIAVFPKVIDNTKMLLNFVQIVRSGKTGRKSFGSAPKRLIQAHIVSRDPNKLFADSIGAKPSLSDVIKMVHPKPESKEQEALFHYMNGATVATSTDLSGKVVRLSHLPSLVQAYERYKATREGEVPQVPFQMLASLDIPKDAWKEIAKNGGWHMVRMNLNTFLRHGVFEDPKMVKLVADKLRDKAAIAKAKVFPYQLMIAYLSVSADMPIAIKEALQDAMEIATKNVPAFSGHVYVACDVSGSMSSAITGNSGMPSKVRCIDVAALMSSTVLRNTKEAEVLPFEDDVVSLTLNPRDSVMTNATKLAKIGGGGTCCGAPIKKIADSGKPVDLVIIVSDNESWRAVDKTIGYGYFGRSQTDVMTYWNQIKAKNPNAKLVNIDIQPYVTSQTKTQKDILNIGGFSDNVFSVIADFVNAQGKDWRTVINEIAI